MLNDFKTTLLIGVLLTTTVALAVEPKRPPSLLQEDDFLTTLWSRGYPDQKTAQSIADGLNIVEQGLAELRAKAGGKKQSGFELYFKVLVSGTVMKKNIEEHTEAVRTGKLLPPPDTHFVYWSNAGTWEVSTIPPPLPPKKP